MALPQSIQNAMKASVSVPSTFIGSKLDQIVQVFDLYALKAGQFSRDDMDIVTVFKQFALVVAQNEQLKKCSTASLMGFAYTCAANGFSPLPQDKEAYAVPYVRKFQENGQWKSVLECQFQNGYGGIIKKIMRSGYVSFIDGYAVYEGDYYKVYRGTDPRIEHEEGPNYGDPTKVTDSYAVAHMKDGGKKFVTLNRLQLDRLRLKSSAQWVDGKKGGTAKLTHEGMWKEDGDSAAIIKVIKKLGDQLSREVMHRETRQKMQLPNDNIVVRIEENRDSPLVIESGDDGSAEVVDESDPLAAQLAKEQAEAQQKLPLQ